ncbi:DNA translocase FtsK 4TM domain-containing protein [Aureimonas sp. AU4]|uniref:FtsK/SpoIIIE family DNA translocase n=1 Tax=Aureimonas sp. AU4 TaxID=1638163 RepID=UPI0035B655C9
MAAAEIGEATGHLQRPARLAGGAALLALAGWLAVSLASWNVDDPSLSYANGNAVRNWAGGSGAVAADLAMQVFGLASVLLPLLLVVRSALMLAGRRAGRAGARAWWALAGVSLASAALGSIEQPAGWPLPTGLGGVVGDLVLRVPALLTGGYPSGAVSWLFALLFALPALWCLADGGGLVGAGRGKVSARAARPAANAGALLDEDDGEGEGRAALLKGLAAHWMVSARSALGRGVGALRRREDDPFGHRQWDADVPLMPPAPAPRMRETSAAPARAARVVVAEPSYAYEEPEDQYVDEDGVIHDAAPPAHASPPPAARPAAAVRQPAVPPVSAPPEPDGFAAPRRTVDTSRATVRHGRSDWNGIYKLNPRPAAVSPGPEEDDAPEVFAADERPEPHDRFADEEFGYDERHEDEAAERAEDRADERRYEIEEDEDDEDDRFPTDEDEALSLEERIALEEAEAGFRLDADERRAPVAEEAEEAGGWRGFIANNIVAFPGLKRSSPKAEPVAPAAAAPQRPPVSPVPARAPGVPVQRPAAAPLDRAPARVVAGSMPVSETTSAQSSRARLAELGSGGANPEFILPPIELLSPPKPRTRDNSLTPEILQDNARLLEGVLDDFGVKGEIIEVRPGPVVTLYELEPAPGIKSSRVIGLADDIARSMSAIAARVAVIPGKNAIGIELPNQRRETVYFREMIGAESFSANKGKLPLALGKTIGGEAVIADLAKMPHLLVAGTTGSGKSVSINTMILSLLYRMSPAECRMIMIDPKMLELSIYDGIPHLLAPVVTDPKKAVVALKWTVKEMEDRYRKMSKVGVRNIDGFNTRVASAIERGETISRTVQTGFDRETGEPIFESEEFDLQPLPYIVVIIDEMADLMMVAGKDIEGTVQRLAQMARAAGIHVIMATQRPSVDVITGTIKANFPTRISFQVTSKIDSRTILQEQGAEQLLGMGDMLFMAGGGRIQRVHGPFVDDAEVEQVVRHLKSQGVPDYLDAVLIDEDEEGAAPAGGGSGGAAAGGEEAADLYDQAVAVVLRDGKASTSYVQRRLQIGYNRAASIIERMEREGIVGPANHAGKREILVPTDNA